MDTFHPHPLPMAHRPALLSIVENTRAGDLLPHHFTSLKVGQKVVYFVRHGQSSANIAPEEVRGTQAFRDACLTDIGHSQAKALQKVVAEWDVQVIYTSPLTRAMQTTCLAFQNTTVPIIAWPIVTEFYPHMPECQGRNVAELRESLELTSLKRFQDIRLDGVHDDWWHIAGDRHGRLSRFLQWLAICPETRIAVVAHWGFLHELLVEEVGCNTDLVLHNCNYVRTVWACDTEALSQTPPRYYGVFLLPTGGAANEAGTQLAREIRDFFKACLVSPALRQTEGVKWGGLFHAKLTQCIPLRDLAHVTELRRSVKAVVQRAREKVKKQHFDITADSVRVVSSAPHANEEHVKLTFTSSLLMAICEELAALAFDSDAEYPEDCFQDGACYSEPFAATLFKTESRVYPTSGPITKEDLRPIVSSMPILESILFHDASVEHLNPLALEALSAVRWEVALVSHDETGPRSLRVDASFAI